MSQKITKNFSFYEFRPKGKPKSWMPANEFTKMLVTNLATNLQVVRSAMPRGDWIKITSGVRAPEDYDRLINAGYIPSTTSDHNFGNAVKLTINTIKYKKYGPTYNFSVGAADCISHTLNVHDLFLISCELVKRNECRFGQVIYEENPKTGAQWVHFGADPTYYFSEKIVNFMGKQPFLVSMDGGKSYQTP